MRSLTSNALFCFTLNVVYTKWTMLVLQINTCVPTHNEHTNWKAHEAIT